MCKTPRVYLKSALGQNIKCVMKLWYHFIGVPLLFLQAGFQPFSFLQIFLLGTGTGSVQVQGIFCYWYMKNVAWARRFSLFSDWDMCNATKFFWNRLISHLCGPLLAIISCLCDIPPSLPHADLQRALNANAQRAAGPSVHFTDDGPQSSAASNTHMLPTEESNRKPAASTGLDFLPVKAPDSPVTSDVFQLAPFKTPTKDNASSGASLSASHKPSETLDIFLQAPFGKKQETTKSVSGSAHVFKEIQAFQPCHLVPAPPPAPTAATAQSSRVQPTLGHIETPLLQQPVAVHRVVSRIGQQAAVGSVAVGPLHAWTVGGRALEDPFTAAPFQPRCSHKKPWCSLTMLFFFFSCSEPKSGSLQPQPDATPVAPFLFGFTQTRNRLEK